MNRILLIEDDQFAYLEISQLLKGIGYDRECIIRCADMKQVMELEDVKDIQIVLTDLSLPDSDYGETFEKVHKKFNYIPVIVLTGIAELDFAIKTIQNGAQDYLVKGNFDKKMLNKAIQYAIERKKIANDYTRVFNESPVPMYVFDSGNYKFLSVNTAALNQYGYTNDEFLELFAYSIRAKEEGEEVLETVGNGNSDYIDVGQTRHVKKDGTAFFVHIYAHHTWFEGKRAWVASAINIDKKVIAEIALLEKTEETEKILDSITDGFFTLNNEWKLTYVNKESQRTLKHTREELIGRTIWEVLPEARQNKFYLEFLRAKKDNVSVHFEEHYALLGIWVSVNAYPTREGLTVFFVDVTEQRSHVQMIETQNRRLREIAWIQSHEVRSPVANIQGLLLLFNFDNYADPLNVDIMEHIKEATGRLDEITRRITAHTVIDRNDILTSN